MSIASGWTESVSCVEGRKEGKPLNEIHSTPALRRPRRSPSHGNTNRQNDLGNTAAAAAALAIVQQGVFGSPIQRDTLPKSKDGFIISDRITLPTTTRFRRRERAEQRTTVGGNYRRGIRAEKWITVATNQGKADRFRRHGGQKRSRNWASSLFSTIPISEDGQNEIVIHLSQNLIAFPMSK